MTSGSGDDEAYTPQHFVTVELDTGRVFHDGGFGLAVSETEPDVVEVGLAATELETGLTYHFHSTVQRPFSASNLLATVPGVAGGAAESVLEVRCSSEPCAAAPLVAPAGVSAEFVFPDNDEATGRITDPSGQLSASVHGPWIFTCSVLPSSLGRHVSTPGLVGDEARVTPFCQAAWAELGVRPSLQDAN